MIRRNQGTAAAVKAKRPQRKMAIIIKMIEVQERQEARISAGIAEESTWLDGFELGSHEPGRETASPFVEVAHDNAWSGEVGTFQDRVCQQMASLVTAFKKSGTEVNIEDVRGAAGRK